VTGTSGWAFDLPPSELEAWLSARDAHGLDAARRAELALTCACARGDPRALAVFEAEFLPWARQAASRFGDSAFVDEVCQQLRRRLLVAEGGRAPRIGDYRGRGALDLYVKAVAVRLALNALPPAERAVQLSDEALLDVPAPAEDPELAVMKLTYRGEFKQAFTGAVRALDEEARTVLRLYYLDGLGLAEVARLYGWSVPTASRRLASARAQVAAQTRALLGAQLKLSPTELDSLLRLIDSELSGGGLASR